MARASKRVSKCVRPIRVHDDLYFKLKDVQKQTRSDIGVDISLTEAGRILARGEKKKKQRFDFSLR